MVTRCHKYFMVAKRKDLMSSIQNMSVDIMYIFLYNDQGLHVTIT